SAAPARRRAPRQIRIEARRGKAISPLQAISATTLSRGTAIVKPDGALAAINFPSSDRGPARLVGCAPSPTIFPTAGAPLPCREATGRSGEDAMASRATSILIALLLSVTTSAPGMAQRGSDVAGAKDHPLIKRYEGAVIIGYESR